MIATRSRGSVSATAMAARSPAPPPPTMRTSWAGPASAAMVGAVAVFHRLAVVPDRPHLDAAVVVLVADTAASAGVVLVPDEQTVVVIIEEVVAAHGLAARGLFVGEGDACAGHLSFSHVRARGGLSHATGRRRAGHAGRGAPGVPSPLRWRHDLDPEGWCGWLRTVVDPLLTESHSMGTVGRPQT